MKAPALRSPLMTIGVLAIALVLSAAVPLTCQTPNPDRYLDGAPARDGHVRLVI